MSSPSSACRASVLAGPRGGGELDPGRGAGEEGGMDFARRFGGALAGALSLSRGR